MTQELVSSEVIDFLYPCSRENFAVPISAH